MSWLCRFVVVFGCFLLVKSNPLTRLGVCTLADFSGFFGSQRDISTIWNGTEVLFSRFTFIDDFSVPKWWDGQLTTSRAKPRTVQVGIYLSASLDWWTPTLGTIIVGFQVPAFTESSRCGKMGSWWGHGSCGNNCPKQVNICLKHEASKSMLSLAVSNQPKNHPMGRLYWPKLRYFKGLRRFFLVAPSCKLV